MQKLENANKGQNRMSIKGTKVTKGKKDKRDKKKRKIKGKNNFQFN